MVNVSRARGMTKALRQYLKRFSFLVTAKRYCVAAAIRYFPKWMDADHGSTTLNIVRTFPIFIPNSGGRYKDRAQLTVQTINQTFPALRSLARSTGAKQLSITPIRSFPQSDEDMAAVRDLKTVFDQYRSDKANFHDYHFLYGPILKNRRDIRGVFEIGLGTNNTDVVSTMGASGKPGASLRAFRDFLTNAKVYGADIDTRILFREDRIETFFVDQTKPETFEDLDRSIPSGLDLVIDDGLHSPDANIFALKFGLSKVKVHGWVVIEDIGADAVPLWEVVSSLLPDTYERYLLSAEGGFLFAVRRLA